MHVVRLLTGRDGVKALRGKSGQQREVAVANGDRG